MTTHPDHWNRIYEGGGRPGWDLAGATPVLGEALAHACAAGLGFSPRAMSLETCRDLAKPRFDILHLAHADTGHPRRAGREFLLVARRRQD